MLVCASCLNFPQQHNSRRILPRILPAHHSFSTFKLVVIKCSSVCPSLVAGCRTMNSFVPSRATKQSSKQTFLDCLTRRDWSCNGKMQKLPAFGECRSIGSGHASCHLSPRHFAASCCNFNLSRTPCQLTSSPSSPRPYPS